LGLAQLCFVRCLVAFGLSLDDAGTVVSAELERARAGAERKRRRRMTLVSMRLIPAEVLS
jgi:hypothetical protein